jgi:hypothetical protein
MTVTPLHAHPRRRTRPVATPRPVAVAGSFSAPSGSAGTFRGSYRLERLVSEHGQTAAAGVFTGELVDADGSVVGTGSRRHTAAVLVEARRASLVAQLGPVEVNVIGFPVQMRALEVPLPRDLPASPGPRDDEYPG